MTNAEHKRLVEAELAKARLLGPVQGYDSEDDWLRAIIATAIADAELVSVYGVQIERFEQPVTV